jgi:hypothetical protein
MTQGLLSESPFEVRLYTSPFREQLCVLMPTASNPIGFRWCWKVLVRYSGKLKKQLKPPTRSPWVQKGAREHEGVTNHQPTPFTILSQPHVVGPNSCNKFQTCFDAFLAHEIDGFTHYLYQEWVYLKIGNSENPTEYHKILWKN